MAHAQDLIVSEPPRLRNVRLLPSSQLTNILNEKRYNDFSSNSRISAFGSFFLAVNDQIRKSSLTSDELKGDLFNVHFIGTDTGFGGSL